MTEPVRRTDGMNEEAAKALRAPFPAEVIGKLPKGSVMLDYVGHAAVTDRLLQVDPDWSWEPLAHDEQGLPAYDKAGGLWIRLTVCGVTRYGYGDGPDPKQRISDAIRNAAMRFGVALDLWAKEDLQAMHREPVDPTWYEETLTAFRSSPTAADLVILAADVKAHSGQLTDLQRDELLGAYNAAKTWSA